MSTHQREIGGGLSHSEVLSDDAKASTKFQWLRLAGLERLASMQSHMDEDLDKLDSASALQMEESSKKNEAAESASRIFRGDSGESNQSSVGDIPIELPHLEEEDDMYNIPIFSSEKICGFPYPLKMNKGESRGRSRSLDDEKAMLDKANKPNVKQKRYSLKEHGKAVTIDTPGGVPYESRGSFQSFHKKQQGISHQDLEKIAKEDEAENQSESPAQRKLFKDFKSTFSASLKSIDASFRSGSITSISSGKSFVSNFSVKSDSGISLPAPKPYHIQELPNLQEQPETFSTTFLETNVPKLGRRNWDSEPALNGSGKKRKKEVTSLSERSSSRASISLSLMGEKEKSKAMQSVESKLMKAIKEVNESDFSEGNTPLNSPAVTANQQKPHDTSNFSPLAKPTFAFQERKDDFTAQVTVSHSQTEISSMEQEINFEELKDRIRSMPKFRPFSAAGTMGGSMDRDKTQTSNSSGWGKQMSLHDELLSHERLTANEEMRKKIQKQQSLPDNDIPKRNRSLKDGLMEVVSKSKQFESLKQSLGLLRSNTFTVVEEKEENLTPVEKKEPYTEAHEDTESYFNRAATKTQPEANNSNPSNAQTTQMTGQAIKSGIVRIWQSWRSTDRTEGPSFTHKRGVSIQPIEVRGREGAFKDGGAACRRNLFQRRRGGSSPLSPQQLEALAREDSMSPTSFRRCCMDCPGGDIVIVDQAGNIRERKLSRGEASDSSSKDGSIQSDTSLDSEDSCVSVIFVPHPDGKFGLTGEPVPELISGTSTSLKASSFPRKQSNSSESSESNHSGKTSPIQSPGIRIQQASPTKGTSISGKTLAKIEVFRQSVGAYETTHAIVSRNVGEDGACSETVYCLTDRPLEKIDERHTESESEAEKENLQIQESSNDNQMELEVVKEENNETITDDTCVKKDDETDMPKSKMDDSQRNETKENEVKPTNLSISDEKDIEFLHKRLSSQKSFEMEDILESQKPKTSSRISGKRKLKSSRERQRAKRPLPPKAKYDYPIVRHHPLFAKQRKPGEIPGQSNNFSSLLMGKNIRIIRGQSLSSNDSQDETRFDIFNPEVDDSDSDDDRGVSSPDEVKDSDSSSSSSCDSNDSVESVVSVSKASESLKEGQSSPMQIQKTGDKQEELKRDTSFSEEDIEIDKRAEKRRQSLMSLLDENQTVLLTISEKKRQFSISGSSSASSLKQTNIGPPSPNLVNIDENALLAAHRASGAIPKKTLPAIVEPLNEDLSKVKKTKSIPKRNPVIAKSKSVTIASTVTVKGGQSENKAIIRQSSVPVTFERQRSANLDFSSSTSSSSGSSKKTSPKAQKLPKEQMMIEKKAYKSHLSPSSTSDTSGIQVKGSHESLTESTDSGGVLSDRGDYRSQKNKTPSPCIAPSEKSMQCHQEQAIPKMPKKTSPPLKKTASVEEKSSNMKEYQIAGICPKTVPKQGSLELPTLDEENPVVPANSNIVQVKRRSMRKARTDSFESKCQNSETSSLISHRFSTISISSNVSSSDVSISAGGGQSGSSCYLASMSSTDFDDSRPVMASSFSLSEAEIESSVDTTNLLQNQQKEKMKVLSKRIYTSLSKVDSSKLPTTTEEESSSLKASNNGTSFARSRIGTETSVETSIENPTCIDHGESFEEELAHALLKDDQDDDVILEPGLRQNSSQNGSSNNSGSNHRTSLSAASSNDSLHSDSGGSQTFHRYYHVFKEGELDYLINTYVESLHIINSYYDHANWCIVAEKVNVWTI